jgi:hypothetical protein
MLAWSSDEQRQNGLVNFIDTRPTLCWWDTNKDLSLAIFILDEQKAGDSFNYRFFC